MGHGITNLTEHGNSVKDTLNASYKQLQNNKTPLVDSSILQSQEELFKQHQWCELMKERAKTSSTWFETELANRFPMKRPLPAPKNQPAAKRLHQSLRSNSGTQLDKINEETFL